MRILLVEDDPSLSHQLTTTLTEAGYLVDCASDGEEGHFLGDTEPYVAVILDVGLPVMDGITVLERWRASGRDMPVLLLTARDRWSEKVRGFDAGADDYVTKPFHAEEVLARLRALLRRTSGQSTDEFVCGPVTLDARSGKVSVNDQVIKLTAHELKVLSLLLRNQGRTLTRTELTEQIYQQDWDRDSNTIEVFIGRLRRKIGNDLIHTVRGIGYQMRAD